MPNLGSNALTLIQDIGVAFLPYLFLLVATFAAGMWGWAQQRTGKVTWQQVKAEAASEAVAAAEQAVAQADKDGKFAFAKTLLEAKVGKLDYAEIVSLIESAVLRLKAQAATQTISAQVASAAKVTSESAKPILDNLGRPSTAQKVVGAVEGDAGKVEDGVTNAVLLLSHQAATASLQTSEIAKDIQLRLAAMEKAAVTPPAPSTKKVVATVTPAAPAEAPTAGVTPPASAQP